MENLKNNQGTKDIQVFNLTNLEETANVIDILKTKPLIVSLKNLKSKDVQRAVDIILGGAYASNKKICKLDRQNVLITE